MSIWNNIIAERQYGEVFRFCDKPLPKLGSPTAFPIDVFILYHVCSLITLVESDTTSSSC